MARYDDRMKIVTVLIFAATITVATHVLYSPGQALAQEDSGESEIPQATCNYAGQKYYLTPHIYKFGEKSTRIDFPDLPDDYMPKMIVKAGEELTMEFDDTEPIEIQAFLVDYDADITETYPLEKIDENTFAASETGIRTLEVIATFADNEHVSYTTLIDVKGDA
jgi:hypothetical protein